MKKIYVFLSVCVMVMIFIFSSQDEEKTYSLSGKTVDVTSAVSGYVSDKYNENHTDEDVIGKTLKQIKKKLSDEWFIRKTAHFLLYFLLGGCIFLAFNRFNALYAFLSVLICFLYAASDEFHQRFINGRGASFNDVKLDTLSALLSVAVIFIISILIAQKGKKQQN